MKAIKHIFFLLIFLSGSIIYAQEEGLPDGYTVFYHTNGTKSSEGDILDGKPEGYWKTYSEEGVLLSEGNRKNHLLDSLWKFYDDNGVLKMEINYLEGKKNGIRTTYREQEKIEENFVDDLTEFSGETIGYMITHKLERFPENEEIITFDYHKLIDDTSGKVQFKILRVKDAKIGKIEVKLLK